MQTDIDEILEQQKEVSKWYRVKKKLKLAIIIAFFPAFSAVLFLLNKDDIEDLNQKK